MKRLSNRNDATVQTGTASEAFINVQRRSLSAEMIMKSNFAWGSFKFPQVGQEVNFWIEEDSRYAQGVVVYSGDKGATVDIGYLASSGEPGDFSPITEEDRKKNDFISALHHDPCVIGDHRLFKDTAEALYYAIKAGKVPGVKWEAS